MISTQILAVSDSSSFFLEVFSVGVFEGVRVVATMLS